MKYIQKSIQEKIQNFKHFIIEADEIYNNWMKHLSNAFEDEQQQQKYWKHHELNVNV